MSSSDPALKPLTLTGSSHLGLELLSAPQPFHEEPSLAESFRYRIVKRVFELLLILAALPILLPLVAIVCAVVACTSSGPVFYSHSRLRRNGEAFRIWKLRTMHTENARILEEHLRNNPHSYKEWKETQKLKNDPRITTPGRFLRRYSLDEIPQLWNVINGTMSLVGPRPITSSEVKKYGAAFSTYCSVDPGLTGVWQISGRSDLTYSERVILDCEYVQFWSLGNDLKIVVQTFGAVIAGMGAY